LKKIYLWGAILSIVLLTCLAFLALDSQSSGPQNSNLLQSNISITFTGDVMLGRGVSTVLDSQDVFQDLKQLFKSSDLVVINLESPFTTSSQNLKQSIPLKADPKYAQVLKDNNINVVCLANNHIMDYGSGGLNDSITTLKKYNISYIGAGENLQKATEPAYFNVNNTNVAILNFFDKTTFTEFSEAELPPATDKTSGFAPADWNIVKERIDQAKNKSDIVIVVFHYGNEYSSTPNQYQENLSRKSIDEGADLVVGSHTHVPQKVESYKGKLIFYSLGNCVFDQSNTATQESMIAQLKVLNGSAEVTLYPIQIVNYMPKFMDNESAEEFLNSIKAESNADIQIENGKGIITMGKL
jgi:gamma-polyglutamate biosynthesis protein CapA